MSSPSRSVAVYARVSRDKTGAGLSVDRQAAECRELAERRGWTITGPPYVDNDISAYSGKPRPGYRRLLKDIEAGRVGTVVCWHTDRLHRSPSELEEWISACEPRGVEVHTVKAGEINLATANGRAMARTLGAWARYESEHRSERVASAMDRIAKDGGYLGGPRPFGYLDGGMDLHPIEAPLVADGTRMILAGRSLRSVTKMFVGSSTRTTKRDLPWEPQAVRDVLMRARNCALLEHRGQVVGPAKWTPIVSEDEWRGVCAVLNDPARRTTPGNQPRWLGSLIYRCAVCDNTMVVGTSGRTKPYYRCRTTYSGADGRRHVSKAAPLVDQYISDLIVARLSMPDALEFFAPDERPGIDVAAVRADLAGIDEQRTELGSRFGRGEITLAMLDAANTGLSTRQRVLERALADSTLTSPVMDVVTAEDIGGTWAALGLDVRRSVLAELMTVTLHPTPRGRRPNGIYFDPSTIEVQWR